MKDVGVKEFRDHVSEYLSGGEPLAVRDLGESLAELRRETGLSEEKLVEELAPKEREDPERMGG